MHYNYEYPSCFSKKLVRLFCIHVLVFFGKAFFRYINFQIFCLLDARYWLSDNQQMVE